MRKACGQGLTQLGRLQGLLANRDNKADNRVNFRHGSNHRGGGTHAGLRRQRCSNFIQFHAKAANFHLAIRPAQAIHRPIGSDARQITRKVHQPLVGISRQRIGNKPLCGQVRAVQITQRQSGSENAQLARIACRQRTPLLVHNHQSVVRQGASDGDGFARF